MVNLKFTGIRMITARHTQITHDKLWEESQIESDVSDQRCKLAQFFGIHSPGDLRPPIMQATEKGYYHAADHYIMEVRNNEIGIREVDVSCERGRSEERRVG